MKEEKLSIIVTAKVEDALKELNKIEPKIKQIMQQAENCLKKIDISKIADYVKQVLQSEKFQKFLQICSQKLAIISQKIENINWQTLINALANVGGAVGVMALSILDGLVSIFKWISENPAVAEFLTKIAVALGVVSAAIGVSAAAIALWNIVSSPITLTILAIVGGIAALIAIVVLVRKVCDIVAQGIIIALRWIQQTAVEIWNSISQFFTNLWQGITQTIVDVWNNICSFFSTLWEGIKNTVIIVWNTIKDFFINYFNTVKGIFESIWNGISSFVSNIFYGIKNNISIIIEGIKNVIANVLNTIQTIWTNIWNGLKTIVTNIFNGIWNVIKGIINSILGGIEKMANGVINGVNSIIRVLNNLKFDIPDWVPFLGGKTFGFNLKTISTISLPRLAKGNVAYSATMAIFGEYAGASSNPEITAPQNVLRETFSDVLSNYKAKDTNSPMNLAVYVGNEKLGQILLEDLRNRKRKTGKGIEVLIGG